MTTRSTIVLAAASVLTAMSAPAIANDTPPLAKAPFDSEQAKEFQQQWAKHIGKEVDYTNSIGMKLALLPPGEFTMGRTELQLDQLLATVKNHPEMKRNYGGQVVWSMLMMPAHRVRLTRPFYMGATEVTVGQFRRFCEETGKGRAFKIQDWRPPILNLERAHPLGHGTPFAAPSCVSGRSNCTACGRQSAWAWKAARLCFATAKSAIRTNRKPDSIPSPA